MSGPDRGGGHVLVAADKFKGSLSASEVAARVTAGLRHRLGADLAVVAVPVADGGDGTVDAVIASGFVSHPVVATGPTGEAVDAAYARRGTTAAIELASICGLARLPDGRPDPLGATSFGVGQVVAAALDAGCDDIIIGIGGSASTDGGAGMLEALGARVVDYAGRPLRRGGGPLGAAASVDLAHLHPGLGRAHVVVACDVDNPLLGPTGAAAVYGPQKGAGPGDLVVLETGLRRWGELVALAVGHDWSTAPGAGAAGGVGFAALAVLGATMRPGIDLVLDLVDFDRHLAGARLVVTGEGSLDEQTLHGKAAAGVAAAARAAGVTTVAVAGRVLLSAERLAAAGIARTYALSDLEPDPVRCMAEAGPLLEVRAEQIALDWWPEPGRPPVSAEKPAPPGLERLNRLPGADAEALLLRACSSPAWASRMLALRPYADLAELHRHARDVWLGLGPDVWREALAGHPRIGERGGASADLSRQEQTAIDGAPGDVTAAIAAGNRAYEARFGHIFLIRAAGRTPAEVLDNLQVRLGNDSDTELAVAADQHAEITALRLDELVGS